MADESRRDVFLPGFRFHPTDEELVGFYLKRKIQRKPFSIEMIQMLDIYKYNPWDLPQLTTSINCGSSAGQRDSSSKEWYFFCPRDRKYKNSSRPNRVTGAGFWKATGTDRPVYSSGGKDGSGVPRCIGLKKSLVFYKGKASRGIKTDWMMHEFRLPSSDDEEDHKTSSSLPPASCNNNDSSLPLPRRRAIVPALPASESVVICKIFKKAPTSAAQRAVLNSWQYPSYLLPATNVTLNSFSNTNPDEVPVDYGSNSCLGNATSTGLQTPALIQFGGGNGGGNRNCASPEDQLQLAMNRQPQNNTLFPLATNYIHQQQAPPATSCFLLSPGNKVAGWSTEELDSMLTNFSPELLEEFDTDLSGSGTGFEQQQHITDHNHVDTETPFFNQSAPLRTDVNRQYGTPQRHNHEFPFPLDPIDSFSDGHFTTMQMMGNMHH